jgi:hypothetical protein
MATEKSMLSAADDYLIHQTPEVVRHVYTSDRRFYDRHFWTGHANNGELMFLGGMGAYPNLGVIDAFFTFSFADQLITVRGSRELSADRMDTRNVGPFSLDVIEGLKSFRITCAETEGVSFDLTWTHCVRAFEEPPFLTRAFGRVVEQGVRFVQTGRWQGHIHIDGKRYAVTTQDWWGSRDHSWGVRSVGFENEPPGILEARPSRSHQLRLWIWAPLQFEHAAVHFNLAESADGERLLSTVRWMKAGDEDLIELMTGAQQDLVFDRQTRRLSGGSLSFRDSKGERRSIAVTPLRSAYLFAATGYAVAGTNLGNVDDWRHGKYMGPSWSSVRRFDLSDPHVLASIGQSAAHTLCRLQLDTGEIGYADVENTSAAPPQ